MTDKTDVRIEMECDTAGQTTASTTNIKETVLSSSSNKDTRLLHKACKDGNYEEVDKLLQNEAVDINAADEGRHTPLHYACEGGDERIVKHLIEKGADCCIISSNKKTPLHIACWHGHDKVVKKILSLCSKEDKKQKMLGALDCNGYTPLHIACEQEHTEVVKVLLEHEANHHDPHSHIESDFNPTRIPLLVACSKGHTEIVKLLLENNRANINDMDFDFQHTPLGIACMNRHKELVKVLLEHGADINRRNKDKLTELHIACEQGHVQLVKVLLEHDGVDINCTNDNGHTALHLACQEGHEQVVKLLLKHDGVDINCTNDNGHTALHLACQEGHEQVVKLLLKHDGVDINCTNDNGHTALHLACQEGHEQVVKLLLKHDGVDINVTDKNEHTALHLACKKGSEKVVTVLLKHDGVDINVIDNDKHTALHLACQEGHEQVVKLLLEHEAKNHTNKDKHVALYFAYEEGHEQVVKLEHESDIDCTDKDKRTPLHLACEKGHEQIVKLLLEHKAKINRTDKDKHTALHLACEKGHEQVVTVLLKHDGVNINVTDNDKYTALHIACRKGHTQIIKLFLEHKDADVKKCDRYGLNPLDIAVDEGQKDAAMAIVKSDKWQDALRNYTDTRGKCNGIRRRLCCCHRRKKESNDLKRNDTSNDSDGVCNKKDDIASKCFTTPMRRIIQKMPDVAEAIFDHCCERKASPYDDDYEITYNYEFLEDFDQKWTKQPKYCSRNHCLNILARSPSADLLNHPLAATLLDQKWIKYGRGFYYSNLIFYFLFVILLSSFALTLHSPNSKICMEISENHNVTNHNVTNHNVTNHNVTNHNVTNHNVTNHNVTNHNVTNHNVTNHNVTFDCFSEERQGYLSFASVCLIVYSTIMILREAFQISLFRIEYFLSFVNYVEVPLFILTIVFTFVSSNQCFCAHRWQWQIGVIAVFLSWIALILSIRKLPVVGIYVVMFARIFKNFMMVLILALLLISAFAIPLYMIFYDPRDRAVGIRTPFINPWRTILKTIIMTVGEFEMDSLLRQNNEMELPDVQYPVVAFLLLIVFVVLMPILFLNLLISLAVDDTQKIQKSADTHRQILKVKFALYIEVFLRFFFKKVPKCSLLHHLIIVSNIVSKLDCLIIVKPKQAIYPNHSKNVLKQISSYIDKTVRFKFNTIEPQVTVADVKDQIKPLSQEMMDLRSSMDELLSTVNSMRNEIQGRGGGEGREENEKQQN